jgi:hypothetical protein
MCSAYQRIFTLKVLFAFLCRESTDKRTYAEHPDGDDEAPATGYILKKGIRFSHDVNLTHPGSLISNQEPLVHGKRHYCLFGLILFHCNML